jgi:dynein heavy chain
MIPTNDSIRNSHLIKALLQNNYHTLLPGPTGTGKTLNATKLLITGMGEEFQNIPISFSARTSAN